MDNFEYAKIVHAREIAQGRADTIKLFAFVLVMEAVIPYFVLAFNNFSTVSFGMYVLATAMRLFIWALFFFHIWKGRRWARLMTGWFFILVSVWITLSLTFDKSIGDKPLALMLSVIYVGFGFFSGGALLSARNMRLFFDHQRAMLAVGSNGDLAKRNYKYDVAISFAGEDRSIAEALSDFLIEKDLSVFYDRLEEHNLLGKNLFTYLQTIYRDSAQFCVVLVSEHYLRKAWTLHEWEQIQERVLKGRPAKSLEYLLPIRLDDVELPGLNSLTGFVDYRTHGARETANVIYRKFVSHSAER